jgi:hypothetical protein
VKRWRTIDAIDRFCKVIRGFNQPLKAGTYYEQTESWGASSYDPWESAVVKIDSSIKILPGCEWYVDENECGRELRKPIDQCNTDGENRKQGGTMKNNCVEWRIDPQRAA